MKKLIIFLFGLQSMTAFSQFNDSFDDGLFTNPDDSRSVEWSGDVEDFVVNESRQLQLNADGTHSPSHLRTPSSSILNTSWEFSVKMAFAPSSDNYAKVYLTSDTADLESDSLNGLFVRIGHTDKNVRLMRAQSGKNNQTLITGATSRLSASTNSLKVLVVSDGGGRFELFTKLEGEEDYTSEGVATVSNLPESQWFGVVCVYTTTRSALFYFDDFKVETATVQPFVPTDDFVPRAGDVVFSEIMANPATDAPEYVELYNASDSSFNLSDCYYFYGDKAYSLPAGVIASHSYFVLTKTTTTDWFDADVAVFGVPSFPAMANPGKLLMFGNISGELISWFEYSDAMCGDATKKSGGWSLECIDLSNLSNMASNWSASTDESGGTAGKSNSIQAANPDLVAPEIKSFSRAENTIKATFSKPMNRTKLEELQRYQTDNADYQIVSVESNYPYGTEISLQLSQFPPVGTFFYITIDGMEDLSGNALAGSNAILAGEAFEASPNDVVINEILFDAPTDGYEYVEIYNRSDKTLDLRSLCIAKRTSTLGKLYPLANLPEFLNPQEYLVITDNSAWVSQYFNCPTETHFVELSVSLAWSNTSGNVVLLNKSDSTIIDDFSYNDKMHSVSSKKGVALERISFDRPTNDADNWTSATVQTGYGTPGYQNSQHSIGLAVENDVRVEYPAFGVGDYRIVYQLDKSGYRCNLFVYDAAGRLQERIVNNQLLGTSGEIAWNGGKHLSGVHIIYVELYDNIGNVKKMKLPVVVK